MARALRLEFEDALYHLCARGNRRERIFNGEKDYLHFEELLAESLDRYQVELHAYVLLGNHFHLVRGTRWGGCSLGSYLNIQD
jgi:putative transposase